MSDEDIVVRFNFDFNFNSVYLSHILKVKS